MKRGPTWKLQRAAEVCGVRDVCWLFIHRCFIFFRPLSEIYRLGGRGKAASWHLRYPAELSHHTRLTERNGERHLRPADGS